MSEFRPPAEPFIPDTATYEEKVAFLEWAEPIRDRYELLIIRLVDEGTLIDPRTYAPNPAHDRQDENHALLKQRYEAVKTSAPADRQNNISPFERAGEFHVRERLLRSPHAILSQDKLGNIRGQAFAEGYIELGKSSFKMFDDLFDKDGSDGSNGFDEEVVRQTVAEKIESQTDIREYIQERMDALSTLVSDEDSAITDVSNCVMQVYLAVQLLGKKAMHQQVIQKMSSLVSRHKTTFTPEDGHALLDYIDEPYSDAKAKGALQVVQSREGQGVKEYLKLTAVSLALSQLQAQKEQAEQISAITRDYFVHIADRRLNQEDVDDEVSYMTYILRYLRDWQGIDIEYKPDTASQPTDLELAPTQLDWEILPPGKLADVSRTIVDDVSARENKKAEIALERLKILEVIREQWGKDQCYYTRGTRKKRSTLKDESGVEQPDEYIVLVLQQLDGHGKVTQEHAVAESPITQRNALYIFRQDVSKSGEGWRTVMSLPKTESQKHGARALQHRPSSGRSQVEAMSTKIEHLLTCTPEEFTKTVFSGFNRLGALKVKLLGGSAVKDSLIR